MKKAILTMSMLTTALLCLTCMTGCEDRRLENDITVNPQSSTLTRSSTSVVLTVEDPDGKLVRPLRWSVTNPALGNILRAAGDSAIYQSTGTAGRNGVVVTDDTGREGVAEIVQI